MGHMRGIVCVFGRWNGCSQEYLATDKAVGFSFSFGGLWRKRIDVWRPMSDELRSDEMHDAEDIPLTMTLSAYNTIQTTMKCAITLGAPKAKVSSKQ
jgi:hypothetical protein